MAEVAESWKRIELWLASKVPSLATSLAKPATDEVIDRVENQMEIDFPPDLRESYLVHDGAEYGEGELNIFPAPLDSDEEMAFCLLPVTEILSEWEVWRDLIDDGEFDDLEVTADLEVQDVWWSKGWIPVAGNGGGDFICVDLRPAEEGQVGQVICAWHDDDVRTLVADSWSDYLAMLAEQMESGHLSYSEDDGLVHIGSDDKDN